MPTVLEHFESIAGRYDVLLCDVWGVVHNGVRPFAGACDALARFRKNGGAVVLITNAPRPGPHVIKQVGDVGVARDVFDDVASSGDVTQSVIRERKGQTVFHIGPERDLPIFTELDVALVAAEQADYVVCTGLFDDTKETPEDYAPLLARLKQRGLFMLCGNPDVVVSRGNDLIYCAGALADAYAAIGGEVFYAGKPHRPIYDMALAKAEQVRGRKPDHKRILAIGDSIRTDLIGANAAGLDFLFIRAGIHAEEFADPAVFARALAEAGAEPIAVMQELR